MNLIAELEQEQLDRLVAERGVPDFRPGDTLKVNVKVIEGTRERVQAFEGVCIARRNRGINSAFTVRKISYGEGVERVFPLHSPRIDSIEVVRRGRVRRAKLYYLRGRTGKSARIAERRDERPAGHDAGRGVGRLIGEGGSMDGARAPCSRRSGTRISSTSSPTAPASSISTGTWSTRSPARRPSRACA